MSKSIYQVAQTQNPIQEQIQEQIYDVAQRAPRLPVPSNPFLFGGVSAQANVELNNQIREEAKRDAQPVWNSLFSILDRRAEQNSQIQRQNPISFPISYPQGQPPIPIEQQQQQIPENIPEPIPEPIPQPIQNPIPQEEEEEEIPDENVPLLAEQILQQIPENNQEEPIRRVREEEKKDFIEYIIQLQQRAQQRGITFEFLRQTSERLIFMYHLYKERNMPTIDNEVLQDNQDRSKWFDEQGVPPQCKRRIYTDQSGILRSIVICEDSGQQRLYHDK